MKFEYQFRVENFTLNIYKDHLFETNSEKVPEIDIVANRLALNYQLSAVESDQTEQEKDEERLSLKAQTESFEVNTYRKINNKELDKFNDKKRRPKELSQMMIK